MFRHSTRLDSTLMLICPDFTIQPFPFDSSTTHIFETPSPSIFTHPTMPNPMPYAQARRAKRADENAPPAPSRTRSTGLSAKTTVESSKDANIKSSIPVMKRSESSKTITKSRSALGEVTNAGRRKSASATAGEKGKAKVERKPLASTNDAQQGALPMRRTRSSATDTQSRTNTEEREKDRTIAGKRKIASHVHASQAARSRSTTAASTSTNSALDIARPLAERVLNVKDERDPFKAEEEEPVHKRRRTSTPPFVEDDIADEAQYDQDGEEILLSSGGKAIHLKSPKRERAKDEGWEDLDAEDEGDPTMVSEYVVDAFRYMIALEVSRSILFMLSIAHAAPQTRTMPDPDYMDSQNELHWQMRTILMDWLIEVHSKFRLLPETLFIASNLIDRFLSARVISLIKFQLVGLTALFIAAKYEEVICPSITHFLHMTDGGYGVEEILKAERYMLTTLGFDLSYPNPLHFLRRISKADGYDIQARTVGKYLVEISCIDQQLMQFPPSLLAAAAMWLARYCLERGDWVSRHPTYDLRARELTASLLF